MAFRNPASGTGGMPEWSRFATSLVFAYVALVGNTDWRGELASVIGEVAKSAILIFRSFS